MINCIAPRRAPNVWNRAKPRNDGRPGRHGGCAGAFVRAGAGRLHRRHCEYVDAAAAAAAETEGAELAKKLSNPLSDLFSVPFQFNWENGIGPLDQTRYILNIQPVMHFR